MTRTLSSVACGERSILASCSNNPYRGMHGSFSPIDVHNTLIAYGPDFREGMRDTLPTGNVDVAPTIASILGLESAACRRASAARSLKERASDEPLQVVSPRSSPGLR